MRSLLTILFLFCISFGKSQEALPASREQVAFSFLVDSVLCTKYPASSVFHVRAAVDSQLSQLRLGTGAWKEYDLPPDSSEAREIEAKRAFIRHSSIEGLTLPSASCRQMRVINATDTTPQSSNNFTIRVRKRSPGRQGRDFVEVVVFGQDGRTHYFFELEPTYVAVIRWYQIDYYY